MVSNTTEALRIAKERMWSKRDFLAILAIIAAVQGADLCNQDTQRDELHDRIDTTESQLDECLARVDDCYGFIQAQATDKIEDLVAREDE